MKRATIAGISAFLVLAMAIGVFAAAGGQGKTQGNSCMAQCIGANADFYDASKDTVQNCKAACGVGDDVAGQCSVEADDCCVPATGNFDPQDPDCGPTCPFTAQDIQGAIAYADTLGEVYVEYYPWQELSRCDIGAYEPNVAEFMYLDIRVDYELNWISSYYLVLPPEPPIDPFSLTEVTQEELDACTAILEEYCVPTQ